MITVDVISRLKAQARAGSHICPVTINGSVLFYMMTIPDHIRAVLVMIEAKAKWKTQHRLSRIERRKQIQLHD